MSIARPSAADAAARPRGEPRRQAADRSQFSQLLRSDDAGLDRITRAGVGSGVVVHLAGKLRLPPASFVAYLGLSRATLDRKLRTHAALGLVESDRVVRYAQLWKQAVHLWGGEDAAREWLTAPEPALGGATPIEHAVTEVGSRRVEDLMGQLAHGIPA